MTQLAIDPPVYQPTGECEPWSTTQPSRCGNHPGGILCQLHDEPHCGSERSRAVVWYERRVRGNVPGHEGEWTYEIYSVRACADCVAEAGDDLERCSRCGDYYHVDVGGLLPSGICWFCDAKEASDD